MAAAAGGDAPNTNPTKRSWPLWDGQETIADYAKRAGLEPTKALGLGNGVSMELVLIPSGRFSMGAAKPEEPDGTIISGQAILGIAGTFVLLMILLPVLQAIRTRSRFRFSLSWLVGINLASCLALYGGVRWREMAAAWEQFKLAYSRYGAAKPEEKPAHSVLLTVPFYIGKWEVTQEQYGQVVGQVPSFFKGKNLPMEYITWNDWETFLRIISERTGLLVRLPTEAEWEYACRAGTRTEFSSGNLESAFENATWYQRNSGGQTHPVGQKHPNAFGVYDMQGNVWEWCSDWYDFDYYSRSPLLNPKGPQTGTHRIHRGGFFESDLLSCRAAYRSGSEPDGHNEGSGGIRVVVEASQRTGDSIGTMQRVLKGAGH